MLKILFSLYISLSLNAAEFRGWEGLRVLPIEGGVSASEIGDVYGTGKDLLFIANRRQSRIDIYKWLSPDERKKAEKNNLPNELPFARDFERSEIVLERPPFDILLKNLDDDKEMELLVLTTLPLTLHLYNVSEGKWQARESWKMPNVGLQSLSMLSYKKSILLSTEKGVVVQELEKDKAYSWLKPVESTIRRINWWIFDIDQDGEDDLVDLVIDESDRARFRWFKSRAGSFLPAIPLGDVLGTNGRLDETAKEPSFFFQNPVRSNTINEYVLEKGKKTKFGMNRILPVLSTREDQRTSVKIENKNCLVEVDPERPTMRVSELSDDGFVELGNYPILRKTRSIIAPNGKSYILMRVGDSPDLYVSHWQKGRFTYPEIFMKSDGKEESRLLGFGMHASVTWWLKSSGSDITLGTLSSEDQKPQETVFKDIGKGFDSAFWLGGDNLMVRKKYAKNASFYSLKAAKPTAFQAAHLKDAQESQFRFFYLDKTLAAARIIDGIIQWYGEDLQPIDQVMLENGVRVIDAAFDKDSLYVLDETGKLIHRLEKDKSGLMKEVKSYEVLSSSWLKNDLLLGFLLGNTRLLNAAAEGSPLKYKLKNSINEKIGLPSGVKNAKISSFRILDIAGTKRNELINIDYNRHQLTLIDISKKEPKALASWKVFDDGKYPYSDGSSGSSGSSNPYMILSLDFDGDGTKELLMGCHDRLLIYLGKEVGK